MTARQWYPRRGANPGLDRRRFLGYGAALAGATLLGAHGGRVGAAARPRSTVPVDSGPGPGRYGGPAPVQIGGNLTVVVGDPEGPVADARKKYIFDVLQEDYGVEEITIPRGTQPGHVFRLRGLGVPRVRGRGRGDLLVTVVVDVPETLDEEREALYRQLAALGGEDVAPPETGLLSKFRSAFK